MITHILKDPLNYKATFGAVLMLTTNWIVEHVNPVLGVLAGVGGLIIMALSIREKIKKERMSEIELKIKREELRQLIEKHK